MVFLYSATLFHSALLLFLVQPMVGRMLSPQLGGTPAVWNTCLVFFQMALLAGYTYAHATAVWLGPRRQAGIHIALLAGVAGFLAWGWLANGSPLRFPDGTSLGQTDPMLWVFGVLFVNVAFPFVVLSGSAPLLQRWFADTDHPAAQNPYFLYAASNAGSLLALLGYPFLVELLLPLGQQSAWWGGGVILLGILTTACAVRLWRSPAPLAVTDTAGTSTAVTGWQPRLQWLFLAFVPSSLLMGVTDYLSTEVLSHPILWIIPLTLYLLTFIFVFASKPPVPHELIVRWAPFALLLLSILLAVRANQPTALIVAAHLLTFFFAAMLCHGELALRRPGRQQLTEFYLYMSVGGMLGGVFNALLAPLLFRHVGIVEYPLGLILACLVLPRPAEPARRWEAVAWPLGVLLLSASLVAAINLTSGPHRSPLANLAYGIPALLLLPSLRWPMRLAGGVAALSLVSAFDPGEMGRTLALERNFYGLIRVTHEPIRDMNLILHGSTIHSIQSRDPKLALEPTAYYYPEGPVSQVFAWYEQTQTPRRIAVAGLGAGGVACYAKAGQEWTFYEIDPLMLRVAQDTRYFTFLHDCFTPRGAKYTVELGDARLRMREAESGKYGMILMNAFSGCSPPVHLLTREAMELYLERLAAGGLLVYNVSNRHLELRPVLAAQAQSLGLTLRTRSDSVKSEEEWRRGKESCKWVVIARRPADLGPLLTDPLWSEVPGPLPPVWTDDYSNLLQTIEWW